jgi:hypothetical protein
MRSFIARLDRGSDLLSARQQALPRGVTQLQQFYRFVSAAPLCPYGIAMIHRRNGPDLWGWGG